MDVLRDERSGICFRGLHGFNSTGSQVSLLHGEAGCPIAGGEHYFTCASDPKVAAYKRFDFSQAASGQGEQIGALSLEAWRLHRQRALERKAPIDLAEIESAAFASSGPGLTQLLQTELGMLR